LNARAKKILREVGYLVLIFVIALLVTDFGFQALFGVKSPLAVVTSGSMRPTLERGDLIFIYKVPANEIKVGDIIVFRVPWSETPIVHRVVEIYHEGGTEIFITKGDNNPVPDPGYRTPNDIYGKVLEISGHPVRVPVVGYILLFFQSWEGRAIIVAAIAFLVITDLIKASKGKSAGREEEGEGSAESDSEEQIK